ncbi:hypothetical protein SAMN05443247_00030 [Bradyrhizobium erythrophlei]|jgi:hypothetical protein|nr:hypothetical protein SAMN05443247_00030 [Bradyrhizobium erythrophlei]
MGSASTIAVIIILATAEMADMMTDEWIADHGYGRGMPSVTPEDEMVAALCHIEAELENKFQSLGADAASTIAESFVATVIRVRRELEAAGETSPRVLN